MTKTLKKSELIASVAKATGLSKRQAEDAINETFEGITNALKKNKRFSMTGFGSFDAVKRAARVGRNPSTGKTMKIAAKTVPRFRAGKKLRETLSKKK
jgi:DNA-binding protein HU-beta